MVFEKRRILKAFAKKETIEDDGEECSFCDRPKGTVLCGSCRYRVEGLRVRKNCAQHPQVFFPMDLANCPKCKGTDLLEFGLDEIPMQATVIPEPLPSLTAAFTPMTVSPSSPFGFMETSASPMLTSSPPDVVKFNVDAPTFKFNMKEPITPLMVTPVPKSVSPTKKLCRIRLPGDGKERQTPQRLQLGMMSSDELDSGVAPRNFNCPLQNQAVPGMSETERRQGAESPLSWLKSVEMKFSTPTSTTFPECICVRQVRYVLCSNCGYYDTSGAKKFLLCPQHQTQSPGLRQCPDCAKGPEDLDEYV